MYNTGNFSELCSEEWDLNTGKWDLIKTNELGNSLPTPLRVQDPPKEKPLWDVEV